MPKSKRELEEARKRLEEKQRQVDMEADRQQKEANEAIMSDLAEKYENEPDDTILDEAKYLIYGDRNKVYKHPTENFRIIANLWNAYFIAIKDREGVYDDTVNEFVINSIDVAYMNILQKVARGATNQEHVDTIIDIAGYAGCIERVIKGR